MEAIELEFGASLAEQEILQAVNPEDIEQQHNHNHTSTKQNSSSVSLLAPEAVRELVCSDIIGDRTTFSSPSFASCSSSSTTSTKEEEHRKKKADDTACTSTSSGKGPRPTSSAVVPLIYCDHTATHRALHSIETYVASQCLPTLGNTHTLTSYTGCQSTSYVAEARQIIAECVNAKITGKASTDVVLFTGGTGVTSAVQLLIDLLQLKKRNLLQQPQQPAVIFVGPYEHHSNLIPWRECGCQIVTVPIHPIHGGIHMEVLEQLLSDPIYGYTDSSSSTANSTAAAAKTARLRIGTFSVASNVTGRIADTQTITALLHQYNVLSFWDYATGASYLPIDMNPTPSLLSNSSSSSSASMDALFLSPHKILGGSAGSCGILVIKKYLVSTTQPPERAGGGTVFYVTNTHHRFLSNRIDRYEGGTPNIPCILRIGLTFLNQRYLQQQLQQQVEANNNHKLGYYDYTNQTSLKQYLSTWQTVVDRLTKTSPNLILLGSKHYVQNKHSNNKTITSTNSNETNLPIFSFLIQCGSRFLHHNYVCALLNDMFGIQTRGGCQCAGPYSQYLLGLTTNDNFLSPNVTNQRLEEVLLSDKIEILRVGFTRLSLPYLYMRDFEIEYVMKALEFISQHGWKFLYQYRCNHRTGEWRHYSRQGKPLGSYRKWLHQFCPPFPKHQHSNDTMNHHDSNKNIVTNQESKTVHETDEECCNDKSSISPHLSDSSNNCIAASDETKIKTDSEKLSLNAWKDLLDFTLEKANKLLQQIHLDTKSIVPIMNSTANDSDILPQSVQDLRWYIYPSECAKMLYEGTEPISNSQQELVKILGAVQPLERKPPTTDIVEDIRHSKISCTPMQNEKLGPLIIQNINHDDKKSLIRDIASSCGAIDGSKIISATTCITKKILRDSSTWGEPYPIVSFVPPSYCCAPNNDVAASCQIMVGQQQWKNTFLNNRGKIKPPAKMMRLVMQAILQWDMIKDGDRLLLGLSGGKDSLSLLHCLLELQRKLPISFTVQVCTIDPMTPSFDPSPLIPYIQDTLGLQYHYISADIVNRATKCGKGGKAVSSLCAFCARMKRGHLYQCAREQGCNKLVLAQHLDDMAESFLMSVMHNGFVRTMKAHYEINAGDLSVIRPLAYCRESLMADFAKSAGLPVINENCPACFEEPKERARVKKLLSKEVMLYPQLYDNIRKAILPLMHDEATAIMRCLSEEVEERTRKQQRNATLKKSMKNRSKMKDGEEEKKECHTGDCSLDGSSPVFDLDINDTTNHLTSKQTYCLAEFSDEQLAAELTRRRAEKYRLHGAMTAKKGFIPQPES